MKLLPYQMRFVSAVRDNEHRRRVLPPAKPHGGLSVTTIILDEFTWLDDSFWEQATPVLEPRKEVGA